MSSLDKCSLRFTLDMLKQLSNISNMHAVCRGPSTEHTMSDLQQIFIAQHIVQFAVLRHVLMICHDDEALDTWKLVLQFEHQVHKCQVQHDVLIHGMVDNII